MSVEMKSDKFYSSHRPTSKLVASITLGDAVLWTNATISRRYHYSRRKRVRLLEVFSIDSMPPKHPVGWNRTTVRSVAKLYSAQLHRWTWQNIQTWPCGQMVSKRKSDPEQTYIDNALHGQSTTWYVNRNRSKTGRYEKGLKTGVWTEWGS